MRQPVFPIQYIPATRAHNQDSKMDRKLLLHNRGREIPTGVQYGAYSFILCRLEPTMIMNLSNSWLFYIHLTKSPYIIHFLFSVIHTKN